MCIYGDWTLYRCLVSQFTECQIRMDNRLLEALQIRFAMIRCELKAFCNYMFFFVWIYDPFYIVFNMSSKENELAFLI